MRTVPDQQDLLQRDYSRSTVDYVVPPVCGSVMVCSGAANVLAGAGPVHSSQTVCFCSPGSTQPVPLCPRLRPLAVTWPLWHQSPLWMVDADDAFVFMPKNMRINRIYHSVDFMNAFFFFKKCVAFVQEENLMTLRKHEPVLSETPTKSLVLANSFH